MQQPSAVAPPIWNGPQIPANVFPWQLAGPQNVPMQIHGMYAFFNLHKRREHKRKCIKLKAFLPEERVVKQDQGSNIFFLHLLQNFTRENKHMKQE